MSEQADSWVFGEGLGDEGASIVKDGFENRESALAAGSAYYELGDTFQTAFKRWSRECPDCPLLALEAIETAGENAEFGEGAVEQWNDKADEHSEDLDAKLDAVWDAWAKEHDLYVDVYYLDDVETHAVAELP